MGQYKKRIRTIRKAKRKAVRGYRREAKTASPEQFQTLVGRAKNVRTYAKEGVRQTRQARRQAIGLKRQTRRKVQGRRRQWRRAMR